MRPVVGWWRPPNECYPVAPFLGDTALELDMLTEVASSAHHLEIVEIVGLSAILDRNDMVNLKPAGQAAILAKLACATYGPRPDLPPADVCRPVP